MDVYYLITLEKQITSVPRNIRSISFLCDSCGGQNRNQFIVSFLHYSLYSSHLVSVEIKYLVSGHTAMDVDSMHSTIETAKKRQQNVYIPSDWENIIKGARKADPYIIIPLVYDDFMNFKAYSSQMQFNTKIDDQAKSIKWTKIRAVKLTKEDPGTLYVKYDFEDEYISANLFSKKTIQRSIFCPTVCIHPPVLYEKELPISSAKKGIF